MAVFPIMAVRTAAETDEAARLLRAYAASLDIDLAYQDFDSELSDLPGKYAPPSGELLLARDAMAGTVGCVGLRALAKDGVCEMKRLYVAPQGRGAGLGRLLVTAIVAAATRIGYHEIRLDTLATMHSAQALYRSQGFQTIDPCYDSPADGTIFMSRRLSTEVRA